MRGPPAASERKRAGPVHQERRCDLDLRDRDRDRDRDHAQKQRRTAKGRRGYPPWRRWPRQRERDSEPRAACGVTEIRTRDPRMEAGKDVRLTGALGCGIEPPRAPKYGRREGGRDISIEIEVEETHESTSARGRWVVQISISEIEIEIARDRDRGRDPDPERDACAEGAQHERTRAQRDPQSTAGVEPGPATVRRDAHCTAVRARRARALEGAEDVIREKAQSTGARVRRDAVRARPQSTSARGRRRGAHEGAEHEMRRHTMCTDRSQAAAAADPGRERTDPQQPQPEERRTSNDDADAAVDASHSFSQLMPPRMQRHKLCARTANSTAKSSCEAASTAPGADRTARTVARSAARAAERSGAERRAQLARCVEETTRIVRVARVREVIETASEDACTIAFCQGLVS